MEGISNEISVCRFTNLHLNNYRNQKISEQFALQNSNSYSRSEDAKCLTNNQDMHLQSGELWKFAEHISQLPAQLIICNIPTKVISS
jgi:hypothetical protein